MELQNFFSNYIGIENKELNTSIKTKKEFADLELLNRDQNEKLNRDQNEKFGTLLKHQEMTKRLLSRYTPYQSLLLFHAMGTGKTRSAIATIEENIDSGLFKRGIIFTSNSNIANNFKKEIVSTYPNKYYMRGQSSDHTNLIEINKKYTFTTFITFLKELKNSQKEDYENCILVFDEVHNIISKTVGDQTYEKYHKFLHSLQNIKILLLTGTPMINETNEIAKLLNLILPLSNQLKVKDFIKTYLLNDKTKQEFKTKIQGYVSYLKEEIDPRIKIVHEGELVKPLDILKVVEVKMSKQQETTYETAYESDKKGTNDENKDDDNEEISTFFPNAQQASLFTYKNNYGTNINIEELKNEITKIKTIKEKINFIKGCSNKYADIIDNIRETNGISFVFGRLVNGSGINMLEILLKLCGIKCINLSRVSNIQNAISSLNADDNKYGDKIKVVLGSQLISEGYTFKNVVKIFIVAPFFNFARIEQAIYRGIRYGSHTKLLEEMKQGEILPISVYKYISNISNTSKYEAIDLRMYKISEDKDIKIQQIKRLLIEASIDCSLYYKRNYNSNDEDKTRECQYTECKYNCDNVSDTKNIDYTTYDLYYFGQPNKLIPKLHKINEENGIIPVNITPDIQLKYLISDTEKEEMKNINYTDFDNLLSNLKKIFRNYFKIHYNTLKTLQTLQNKSDYELLLVLDYIISNNIQLINRYGFYSYLREENNIYFLVNNITDKTFDTNYYSECIALKTKTELLDLKLETILTKKRFDLIETFSKESQNMLLQKLLTRSDIKYKNEMLKIFEDYYIKIDDTYLINKTTPLLFNSKTKEWVWPSNINITNKIKFNNVTIPLQIAYLMYLVDTNKSITEYKNNITKIDNNYIIKTHNIKKYKVNEIWKDYDEGLNLQYNKQINERDFVDGTYKYYGTYNEELDKFCIVKNIEDKKTDSRKISTGSVCSKDNITDDLLNELDINKLDTSNNKQKKLSDLCNEIYEKMKSKNRIKLDNTCGSAHKKKKEDVDISNDYIINKGFNHITEYITNFKLEKYSENRNVIVYNIFDKNTNKYKGSIIITSKDNVIIHSNIKKSNVNIATLLTKKIMEKRNLTNIHANIPDNEDYFDLLKSIGFEKPKDSNFLVFSF
jgi:hypothetical protein